VAPNSVSGWKISPTQKCPETAYVAIKSSLLGCGGMMIVILTLQIRVLEVGEAISEREAERLEAREMGVLEIGGSR
jgi:hypothetical protein